MREYKGVFFNPSRAFSQSHYVTHVRNYPVAAKGYPSISPCTPAATSAAGRPPRQRKTPSITTTATPS